MSTHRNAMQPLIAIPTPTNVTHEKKRAPLAQITTNVKAASVSTAIVAERHARHCANVATSFPVNAATSEKVWIPIPNATVQELVAVRVTVRVVANSQRSQ